MPNPLYVNDGGDNSDGSTWVKAYNLLETALAAIDAGGTIWVQSDHVEANRGQNVVLGSANGVAANPVTIISVTNTNEPPTAGDYENMVAGGGSIDTSDGAWDITLNGWDIWIGLYFISGDDMGISTAENSVRVYDGKIDVADNTIIGTSAEEEAYLEDVDIVQVTAGRMIIQGNLHWVGGSCCFY